MKSKLVFVIMISFLIFVLAAYLSYTEYGLTYDHLIISFLTSNSSPHVIAGMEVLTKLGSSTAILLTTVAIAIVLFYKKYWSYLYFFVVLSIGGVLLNFLLKVAFQRSRPGEMKYTEVFNYSFEVPSYSFPSGHTMRIVILLSFLIYLSSKEIKRSTFKLSVYWTGGLVMLLIPLSRVYVGEHYPTDILAAASISIAWFAACLLFVKKTRT